MGAAMHPKQTHLSRHKPQSNQHSTTQHKGKQHTLLPLKNVVTDKHHHYRFQTTDQPTTQPFDTTRRQTKRFSLLTEDHLLQLNPAKRHF
ncbi:hypothetical protein PROFUN_15352 [Planoprotostelium fungivorum]|uniref:Uncharacterized protein n=1 Tax=Planoprotostelium fungivorum TaxID=1890364 RepID=A0A2P6MWN6_9EUKA|nr:hypothetical protein PROFUN_15352 [Planoprotostelium fungivorum]